MYEMKGFFDISNITIRQIHHDRLMMYGWQEFFYNVLRLHTKACRVDARMAAKQLAVCNRLVNEQLHAVVMVVHQAHDGNRAGRDIKILFHVLGIGKGKPRGADLRRDVLGLKRFVARHHEQIELCLLPVAEKQIFADDDVKNLVDLKAVFHGHGGDMIGAVVFNPEAVKQIVDAHFFIKASFCAFGSSVKQLHVYSSVDRMMCSPFRQIRVIFPSRIR